MSETNKINDIQNNNDILNNYYRGFVELDDNKKAKYSYKKGKPLLTYEDAIKKSNFAGVLNDDTILIDIDDETQSDKLLKLITDEHIPCRIVKTTRGRHFLFKNNKINKCFTHTTLALGLISDIKVGVKNSYQVLKFHDKLRTVEQESEPVILPDFLLPIDAAPDFVDMAEGDGRNQNLFNYILKLQKYHLSVDSIRNILTLINKYILKSPLSENELNLLMRDDAFNKPIFFDNKRFMHEVFGDFLMNNYHIKRLNGMLSIYWNDHYIASNKKIENVMLRHILSLTDNRRKEVLKYLTVQNDEDTEMAPANFILFKNGIYDIKTDEFMSPTPQYVIGNQIPWDYDKNAYSKAVDTVLDNLADGDKNIRLLLEEMIGSCLYRRCENGICFILKGKSSNGKSTLLETIRHLLGHDNTSSLDLNELDDRFSTIMLHNKLANIGDDISDDYIPSTGVFKKIVTGDEISAEQKGVDKIQFKPYCKLLFSANVIPRIGKGKDADAIARRVVIVPLNAVFKKGSEKYDPYIVDELKSKEAMSYIINLALAGLKRWLTNNEFTSCDKVKMATEEFKKDNNPMELFFDDIEDTGVDDSLFEKTTKDVYTRYCTFCSENGLSPYAKNYLNKRLCERFVDYFIFRKSVRQKETGKIVKVAMFLKKADIKMSTPESIEK